MTAREVIARAQQYRQPGLPAADYLNVINEVEARIRTQVTAPQSAESYVKLTEEDMDRELTAAYPYDSMYVHACCAEVDDRENQYANLSNERRYYEYDFNNYAAWYIRTHNPGGGRVKSCWYGV